MEEMYFPRDPCSISEDEYFAYVERLADFLLTKSCEKRCKQEEEEQVVINSNKVDTKEEDIDDNKVDSDEEEDNDEEEDIDDNKINNVENNEDTDEAEDHEDSDDAQVKKKEVGN